MRALIPILALLVISCASLDDLIESGKYDPAIEKGIKILERTPNDHTTQKQIEEAYQLANKEDQYRISLVESMESNAKNQERIYLFYLKMRNRANKVSQYGMNHQEDEQKFAYHASDMKERMCRSYAIQAEDLMHQQTRASYQDAHASWTKVKQYRCGNSEVDSMLQVCLIEGKAKVVMQIIEQPGVGIPINTEHELQKLSFSRNKLGPWVNYKNHYSAQDEIDYVIVVKFNQVQVSNNKTTSRVSNLEKQVITGYEKKKNSEGKIVSIPIYKTVKAKFTTYTQSKFSTQGALVMIQDHATGKVLFERQVVGKYNYQYKYYTYSGDKRALSSNQSKLLKKTKKSFPSNSYMTKQGGKKFAKKVENFVYSQRGRFI